MEEDYLLGVFAVQLGFATPAQLVSATKGWTEDRSRSICARLEAAGVLDHTKRTMLEALVAEAIEVHQGDARETLKTLGGEQLLLQSFGGSLMIGPEGELSANPDAEDRDAERGEPINVSLGQEGKYALKGGSASTAELGRGGLGRVLLAFDEHLGRDVAIKELLDGGAGSAATGQSRTTAVVARFLREARVTGQLEHPNIIPVHEVGRRADGTYYYSMRVVRGRTLGDKLKESKTFADRLSLLTHYVNLCNAIAYAHSRNVVHRDIKPDNVMIGEFGETVVLDWGLAKVRGQEDIRSGAMERELKMLQDAAAGHTIDGSAVGTPAYMSPEQADGRIDEVDERSDVWGLGAMLYELLTGRPPFEGVMPYEILGKVLTDPIEPVRARTPEVPAELAAVAEKALRRERADRYPNAKALADEIEAYLQGQRVGAYTYTSWELVKRFIVKNKALSLGVAAVLVTLVVSSVVVFSAWGREQKARASAEEQKAAAEEQKATAVEQRKAATTNLAQAYVGGAEQRLKERDFGAAYVYAAAALREYQRVGDVPEGPRRVALDSALYQAKVRRTFELAPTLPGPEGRISGLDLSPDGKLLAICTERYEVWLIALDEARPPVRKTMPRYPVQIAFAPDGNHILVAYFEGELVTHALSDLAEVASEHTPPVTSHAPIFSPDRTALVTFGPKSAFLITRGAATPPIALGPSKGAAFSPDGSRLACGTPSGLTLHDAVTGAKLTTIATAEETWVEAFSPDGKRLLVNTAQGPRVIDLEGGSVIARMARTNKEIHTVAALRDGFILGLTRQAELWDGRGASPNEVLWKDTGVISVAASKDGRRVVLVSSGKVRVWTPRTSERARSVPSEDAPMNVAFDARGRRAVFTNVSGAVNLVEVGEDLRSTLLFQGESCICTDAAISADGRRIAVVGLDQVVRLFDADKREELTSRRLTRADWPHGTCSSIESAQDGEGLLVSAPDGRVHLLDGGTLAPLRILGSTVGFGVSLRLSSDKRLVLLGGLDGEVAAWDAKTMRLGHVSGTMGGYISDVTTTLDGSTLITAEKDGWVRRFEMTTQSWRPLLAQRAHEAWVNRLALSPDGKVLLTTSDDSTARAWEPSTGKLLRVYPAEEQISAVAFSPAQSLIALGDGAALTFFPDLRDQLDTDGDVLFESVKKETGRHLDGFAVVPIGSDKATVAPKSTTQWKVAENESRGVVAHFMSGELLPAGTEVEAIRARTDEPYSPRLTTKVGEAGAFALRFPDDTKHFGLRISHGDEVTYFHWSWLLTGVPGVANFVSNKQMALAARAANVELSAGVGHWVGAIQWEASEDYTAFAPVGCAEVLIDNARAYFTSPDSSPSPDPRLDRTHTSNSYFYVFNLAPGEHKVTFRVGKVELKEKVRVYAGATTMSQYAFPHERFPEDPTPLDCMADWPPK